MPGLMLLVKKGRGVWPSSYIRNGVRYRDMNVLAGTVNSLA